MAVVKNMMVRVGANVSSYVKGMREASVAGMAFGKSSKDTQTAAKGYESPLKAAARASRTLKEELEAANKASSAAKARFSSVSQELKAAKDALATVKSPVFESLDAKKPLAQQRAAIEAEIEAINGKLGTLGHGIKGSKNGIVDMGDGSFLHLDAAQAQFAALEGQSDALAQKLTALDTVAGQLGDAFQTATLKSALKAITDQVDQLEKEYRDAEIVMGRTGEKAAQLGRAPPAAVSVSAALRAAGNNAKNLGSKLLSIPSLFKKISGSAGSSTGSVTKLLTSIRNIGVVSLGLRVAGSLFGKLRSMVSSCLTSNAAYTESINTMNYQLTQALAPAIGLVTDLLRRAMPVINGVASAISTVLVAAFGKAEAAAYAASAAMAAGGTYGFDQITKIDSSAVSDTSVQGAGMFTGIADKVSEEIAKIKQLVSSGDWSGIGGALAGYLNGAVDALDGVDIGKKLVGILNGAVVAAGGFLSGFNWYGSVTAVVRNISDAITGISWADIGKLLNNAVSGVLDGAIALIGETDWGGLLNSTLTGIGTLIENIDWGMLLGKLISALGLLGVQLKTASGGVISGLFSLWGSEFEAIGLDSVGSFFKGISKKMTEAGRFVKENLVDPVIRAVKSLFGIGTEASSLSEVGKTLMRDLEKGFKKGWSAVAGWLDTVKRELAASMDAVAQAMVGPINSVIGFINGLLSGVTSGLNKVIQAVNGLSFDIPEWVPKFGGKKFGFTLQPFVFEPIDYLAEGGYAVRPTKAVIGEAGREVALPLDQNTGWAKTVAALINNERSSDSGTPMILQVIIGGKKVHEETIDYINRKTLSTGVCPIHV